MNDNDPLVRELYSLCSGHYLCEKIPLDFMDWEEEDQDQFLVDNAWEPIDTWSAPDLWDSISAAAYATHQWYIERESSDVDTV